MKPVVAMPLALKQPVVDLLVGADDESFRHMRGDRQGRGRGGRVPHAVGKDRLVLVAILAGLVLNE